MDCGGNFVMLENGMKDCSNCEIPHSESGYDYVVKVLKRGEKK
jgi:Zn-finger protein